MPAAPDATADHIRDVNTRYHDVAASAYDSKWGIDFGEVGRSQVVGKVEKALGEPPARLGEALEIGAGTGYFSLNLLQAGIVDSVTATDISTGMLRTLAGNADRLGLEVATARAEAEELPFDDARFDLVLGHAVLHHVPDLQRAALEFLRVLRPGGVVAFCGEPSAYGDRIAAVPKRAATAVAPVWRRLVGAPALAEPEVNGAGGGETNGHHLEAEVDVHAFNPRTLRRVFEDAGFERTRIRGEELLSNAYGWGLRTVESTADPDGVPMAWRRFAFRSYLALQRLDAVVLEPRLPPALFYNLVLSARKPGAG